MKRSYSRIVNVWDLRRMSQNRVPRVVFDYLEGGAEGEVTLRENCHALWIGFVSATATVAFPQIDLRTRVLGTELALPFMLVPVGYSRLMHLRGEVVALAPPERRAPDTCWWFSIVRGEVMTQPYSSEL
jgi:L-lactate dehydrogenase (cytochrome)